MYILKNAFRCISRSKGRNVLIGLIVLAIAVSACIGLSIRQAAQSAKAETLSGMTITAAISFDRQSMMNNMSDGGRFDKSAFANQMNNAAALTLEEYRTYATAASVHNFYYTVTAPFDGADGFEAVTADIPEESDFAGKGHGMMGMSSGDFQVIGCSTEAAMENFQNGTASMVEGSVFAEGTEANDCILSQELASYNDITVGAQITLMNPSADQETYTLNVVGIYTDTATNEGFRMFSAVDPANRIYLSSTALENMLTQSKEASASAEGNSETDTAITGTINATYVFADPDAYHAFENDVRTLGLPENYVVNSQNLAAFENSLVPLNTLSTMAGWFLVVILAIGGIVLVVMNVFSIRERKYEIGVLMAIGMKKRKVALQFLTEVFVVTLLAVILGVGIGAASAVPVTNALLENQVASVENASAQVEHNFGRGDKFNSMQRPGSFWGSEHPSAAAYVSQIDSAMNLTVVLQMLGIAILLTLIAGTSSILFVMRYEPLKILANRD